MTETTSLDSAAVSLTAPTDVNELAVRRRVGIGVCTERVLTARENAHINNANDENDQSNNLE